MTDKKWVYFFSAENPEGSKEQKNLLGGKGANLAEMCSLGMPVPPGFTLTTEACIDYQNNNQTISDQVRQQVDQAIALLEASSGKKFGDADNPLLVSVRSGARVSMPGMMDTVLNLGLNGKSVLGLAKVSGSARFAWDSYRRFVQMYANVVMGMNSSQLESTLEDLKEARGVSVDTELTAEDFQDLIEVYKGIILEHTGKKFPEDPRSQIWETIGAVFHSWNNSRAHKYREINHIPHHWGTAVNIQSMVFGNLGDDSATGVCFTRNPSNGENAFFGEYLVNAQGEDVVAGIRTPAPINEKSKNSSNKNGDTLEAIMPKAFVELTAIYKKLEQHYKDMQDIEFTIEKGKLYILQTRNGKRTVSAGIKIAIDLVTEGIISKEDAIMSIDPLQIDQLLHPRLDPAVKKEVLTEGLPASPGAASGIISFSSEAAIKLNQDGKQVILVRKETSPEDIAGMVASQGIITARGGMTSHAAVVARGMGKTCVAGCADLEINEIEQTLKIHGREFKAGDSLTIDGTTGEVIAGIIPTIHAEASPEFAKFLTWADDFKTLKIRTNADNPEDSKIAIGFGAQGIGLCRTEHMFFEKNRILAVREMIFALKIEDREIALRKLLPYQRSDFEGIFTVMHGLPVNIRLLDPPLHEFLPGNSDEEQELANYLKIDVSEVRNRASQLKEFNPMLGHRGCRLGLSYPEIYRMQVRAIMEAAINCSKRGIQVRPEIMIPLVAMSGELQLLKKEAIDEIETIFVENETTIDYEIGTMIELPRAAILAGDFAQDADFFSFGTNDLTQTTYGFSRDDSGKFLNDYLNMGVMEKDPFVSLDQSGVGFLVEKACSDGRKKNPGIHLGICGEHGGEPTSIDFCHKVGLDYVSCSPYRIPVARIAAAQSAINFAHANATH